MALQSGQAVASEKVPVQWFNGHQLQLPHYHQMDERDGLLMWLRGEFAAANAIIDTLCHHLRAIGDPGEYEGVIESIQQRRCNWSPVLYMQQYFPVAEVVNGLQQVGWRRQQKQKAVAGFEDSGRFGGGGKDYRGGGGRGIRVGGEVNGKDLNNGFVKSYSNLSEKLDGGDAAKVEDKDEKKETNENPDSDSIGTRKNAQGVVTQADDKGEAAVSCHVDESEIISEKKRNLQVSPRTFVALEICEGISVNPVEGMKLYEDLLDDSEISKLTTLVNELRASGKRGQLKGQSFVSLNRPMMGHGREIIQLGVPVVDERSDDESAAWTDKEPIPELLQNVIELLLTEQVVRVKPDSAIIDFFHEGDYSQPHIWPQTFGRPVCVLFLAECEMSIGKVVSMDYPGHYRGALQLSLSPGSMLVMQGRSADFARHAIQSLRKQRILITLVKSQPKKINAIDVRMFPSTLPPPSNCAPPTSRSPSQHIRPMAAKHFNPVPQTAVVSVPTAHPPNNGVQPMFVPILPAIAFSAPLPLPPTSAGWPTGPPRQHPPPPRFPVPGTGVFLPPSAENIALVENGTKKEERENHDKDEGDAGVV
ncbi:hypothetical protein CASFOL_002544 [Castilleja foliolosa]|uniref:Uncharacterized protein n=1 Tax=Castilleja foliolosa TaxID=1961234 RepID=A0ABD3EEV8_9LAMI